MLGRALDLRAKSENGFWVADLRDPTVMTLQKNKNFEKNLRFFRGFIFYSNESENAKAESQAIDATRHL